MAARWDAIRWFLSVHYRFNTRLDTPFWKDVREHADVSGLQPLLDVYAAGAPLRGRDRITRGFANSTAPTFYGLAGVDTILLGQHVPTRLLPLSEPLARWRLRKAGADLLVSRAMSQRDALAAFDREPRLHRNLLDGPDSWAYRNNPQSLF
jgi:tryptophan halogenase